MHVGKKIKKILEERSVNKEEFAEKIGRKREYLYELFKKQHINTELLEIICEVLNVPMSYFLDSSFVSNQVNEGRESYGKSYQDKLIEALERENKMLREEIERLKKENI